MFNKASSSLKELLFIKGVYINVKHVTGLHESTHFLQLCLLLIDQDIIGQCLLFSRMPCDVFFFGKISKLSLIFVSSTSHDIDSLQKVQFYFQNTYAVDNKKSYCSFLSGSLTFCIRLGLALL